jgi:hypothetical protein
MIERSMPALMKELHALEFDYADGEGFDFEPHADFLSKTETREWIRAWTGNSNLDGSEFLVFGQDATGGHAAFWTVRPGAPVLEQPVVFLGSEGAAAVVARNFLEYMWLLAGGVGPSEAVEQPDRAPAPEPVLREFRRFAEVHAGATRTAAEVLDAGRRAFPEFGASIEAICR